MLMQRCAPPGIFRTVKTCTRAEKGETDAEERNEAREEAKHRTRGQPNLTHGGRTHYSSLRFIPATCMSGRSLMKYCIHREDVLWEHMLATVPRAPVCMHSSSLFADLCLMQM